ncbi:MAG: phosphohydrolase [Saprospiraceae bacterium]|nr:phosphohydrolase [Saprospiraceae bacterium]MBL0025592.1 phosphohydrolase [Saprospiraceae bacterium]
MKKFVLSKIEAEIPATLSYHGVHHTIDVLNACNAHIRRLKIPSKDAYLLRTAALMHDIGVMWDYFNHEELAMKFVKDTLPGWGYSKDDIDKVCGMIRATRLPQSPTNLLEEIICDSDVDYLGTHLFYQIGATLFEEFLVYKVVKDEESWDRVQIKFLNNHKYFTSYGQRFREPVKRKYLLEIIRKWGWEKEYQHILAAN